jgi:acetyltransferase-like isoleucine patch superfamily enzyme
MLIISEQAKISSQADIEDSVRGSRIVIESGVVIDAFVKIKPVGGAGDVVIGKNSYINSGTVIYSGNGVQIGADVLIAANCTIAPVNHEFRSRDQKIVEQRFKPSKGGIRIEDDVWIGVGSVILDGALIRKGCVIGALSLVKGELDEYGIYAGNPLLKIGERQ